jgi:hypothetical protein
VSLDRYADAFDDDPDAVADRLDAIHEAVAKLAGRPRPPNRMRVNLGTVVGGRYWDRTSDPCRVNVFRAALAALVDRSWFRLRRCTPVARPHSPKIITGRPGSDVQFGLPSGKQARPTHLDVAMPSSSVFADRAIREASRMSK